MPPRLKIPDRQAPILWHDLCKTGHPVIERYNSAAERLVHIEEFPQAYHCLLERAWIEIFVNLIPIEPRFSLYGLGNLNRLAVYKYRY